MCAAGSQLARGMPGHGQAVADPCRAAVWGNFEKLINQLNLICGIMNIETGFKIIESFLVPCIAFIALYIAYQQYLTNKLKLRLDLYEKRFKIFECLMKLLANIFQNANVSNENLNKFYANTNESEFIFDQDISKYIDEIRNKALRLQFLHKRIETLPVGTERNKLVEEDSELINWFVDQFNVSRELFFKYLSFKKI